MASSLKWPLRLSQEPVPGLAGAALGRFRAARAEPGSGQFFPRLGDAFFELADLRLQPVLRRYGLGGGGGGLSQGPFGILEFLPG